ncbi:MAG: hypothetical protein QM654_17055 [Dysgonamonadaceae bacterium]
MKKIFFPLFALIASASVYSFNNQVFSDVASNPLTVVADTDTVAPKPVPPAAFLASDTIVPESLSQVQQSDDFKNIEMTALSPALKPVVAELAKTSDITKLEYSESLKQTRVTVVNKETKEESILVFDAEGKIVRDPS